MKETIFKLFIFIVIVVGVELIGSYFMRHSDYSWYEHLRKPSITPPGFVFGIVWPILYLTIAISGFLFFKNKSADYFYLVMSLWVAQLIVNSIWTMLFFYFQSPLLGLIDIFILILLVVPLILLGLKVSILGVILLIPYLMWIFYAFILNLLIYIKN